MIPERGPTRLEPCAAGVQHVVDEHDDLARDLDGDRGHLARRDRTKPDVVPIERDVECSARHGRPVDVQQQLRETRRQRHTAGLQTDDDEVGRAVVALDNLMRAYGRVLDARLRTT